MTSIKWPSKPSHELDDEGSGAAAVSEAWGEGVLLTTVLVAWLRREIRPLEVEDQFPLEVVSMAISAYGFYLITPHVRCSGSWHKLLPVCIVEFYYVEALWLKIVKVPIRELNRRTHT